MDPELKQLIEEQGKAIAALQKKNDERLEQLEKKGTTDPILSENITKANKAISDIQAEIKSILAASKRPEIEVKGFDGSALTSEQVEAKSNFLTFAKHGAERLEQKAMVASSDPDGGYRIPRDTTGRIISKFIESSAMRQIASVQAISTDALEGYFDDNITSVTMVSEQGTRSETGTPQIGMWRIPVHEGYCAPRITQRLLDDSAVDFEAWLANKVADAVGRGQETQFVVGDGNGKARGAFTYTPVLTGSGSRTNKQVRAVKTGSNTDLTDPDKLVNVVMALKSKYRQNGQWCLSREGIEKARLLKQDGKYIWTPTILSADAQNKVGMSAGTLLGYSVIETNDLPAFATDNIVGGFGDFREFYQIVDRAGLRTIRDNVTLPGWVKFTTYARWGGDVVNFEAAVYLQSKA